MSLVAVLQGCAQCLDNTEATPPIVQAAYRHAILMLMSTASLIFVCVVVYMRRER